jgi:hypothetical protein
MNFLKLTDNLDIIKSICISPNKKYLAICEKLKEDDDLKKKLPTVTVYNIRASL